MGNRLQHDPHNTLYLRKAGLRVMRKFHTVFGIAAAIGLAFCAIFISSSALANEAPPLSAYGELPAIEDAALSPSGNRIAALLTVRGQRLLATFDSNNTMLSATNVDDMKVRSFDWVGEDKLLLMYRITEDLGYGFATDKHEFTIALTIPIANTAEGETIFGRRRNLVDSVFGYYGQRQIDGRWFAYFGAIELARGTRGEPTFRHGRPYLYQVDLQDYSTDRIALAAETSHDNDWLIDANGEVAVTYDINRQMAAGPFVMPGATSSPKGARRADAAASSDLDRMANQ